MKKRILIDFDGVVHSYTSGWKGPTEIADPPTKGAIEWLQSLIHDDRFEPVIWTSRLHGERDRHQVKLVMESWFISYGLSREEVDCLTMTSDKLPAHLIIDDRAWAFQGTFPHPELMLNFEPWKTPKFDNFFSRKHDIYCVKIMRTDITADELIDYCIDQDCLMQQPDTEDIFCVEIRPDVGPELWTEAALRASIEELLAGELTE